MGDFNPRPRKEGDILALAALSTSSLFQSTPSQRGRRICKGFNEPYAYYFNPRPRKEGDAQQLRRATASCYFNPRPRKEGDFILGLYYNVPLYFNPRPRKEGNSLISPYFVTNAFQSTPSQRGRPNRSHPSATGQREFQSTPSQRGRPSV